MKEIFGGRARGAKFGLALVVALTVSLTATAVAMAAPTQQNTSRAGNAASAFGAVPLAPTAVLYDQMDNPAPTPGGVTSQDFEASFDQFDAWTADDFIVGAGLTWNITGVDVAGEYGTTSGPRRASTSLLRRQRANLPGALLASRLSSTYRVTRTQ